MSRRIDGFTYTESAVDTRGTLGPNGEVQRVFYINWNDLGPFLLALVAQWNPITEQSVWQYYPGDQHPDWPFMYCYKASYEGLGVPSDNPNTPTDTAWDATNSRSLFNQAKVTATYKVPGFDVTGDPKDLVELDLDFSAKSLPMPQGTFTYQSGGTTYQLPADVVVSKIIPICDFSMTLIDVPYLPGGTAATIFSLLGTVNGGTIQGAAPGTALYCGAHTSHTTTAAGTRGWRIQHKWSVVPASIYGLPFNWNVIPVQNGGNLLLVTPTTAGGRTIYDSADHSPLFPASS